MPRYRVRFTRQGVVERTPKDPLKGGFERETYPVGHELEVNDASLNFWLARGCVENLGMIDEPFTPRAGGFTPGPFGVSSNQAAERKPITKVALRGVFEATATALENDLVDVAAKGLQRVEVEDFEDILDELNSDSRMLIETAVADAKSPEGKLLGNMKELREALLDGADILQPPSRRKRHSAPD
jgi:hypothetical protein